MGECKTYGGWKTYQRTHPPPENFWTLSKELLVCPVVDSFTGKTGQPEGGGKRTERRGVRNPFLGGVSFVRFSSPLFFPPPPPWRPLIGSAKNLVFASWPKLLQNNFNSVQTRCIVKGEAQKSPLFWRFSGVF